MNVVQHWLRRSISLMLLSMTDQNNVSEGAFFLRKMVESGVGGSDESFISFAFAVVSVAVIIIYIPLLIRTVIGVYRYYTSTQSSRRHEEITNPLVAAGESLAYIPSILVRLAKDPGVITAGAAVCMQEKVFFFRCCMPKFLKFMIRPKILVLWLWFVLFSSAMYSTLTFDPHGVLGVPKTATVPEIKKAYRALSKIYHPDKNNTEAARDIYIEMRRAYKALVDREAFEEEESQRVQDFSVGVALPRFMTSRENDGLVLFGLLALLFGAPVAIWYKFRTNNELPKLVKHARLDRERIETFMKYFGVPEDPKYAEKQASRKKILHTLQKLGLAPSTATVSTVANFPNFPEFVTRCMDPEKYMTALTNLGFEPQGIATLSEHFTKVGPDEVEAFMEAHPVSRDVATVMRPISRSAFRATRYLFEQHTEQVDQALEKLSETLPFEVRTPKKLIALHKEIYELLDLVYSAEKPLHRQVQALIAMPERVAELLDELEPEMDKAYRKHLKHILEQQAQGRLQKRQMKALHKQMGL